MCATSAILLALLFHFRWRLNPKANPGAIVAGLILNLGSVLSEELLYRGYALWSTAVLAGKRAAILMLVTLFAMSHWFAWGAWGDPQRMASVFCTVGLGALFFSLAFFRTQSLAFPVGLHLGFVWGNATFLRGCSRVGMTILRVCSIRWKQPTLCNCPSMVG